MVATTYSVSADAPGSNPVTSDLFGGAGGAALVVQLTPNSSGNMGRDTFNPFTDWTGTVLLDAPPNLEWDQDGQQITISSAGLYAVDFQAYLQDTDQDQFQTDGPFIYGTRVDPAVGIATSEYYTGNATINPDNVPPNVASWTDRYMIVVGDEDVPLSFQPKIYGAQYHNGNPLGDAISCKGIITVTKIA